MGKRSIKLEFEDEDGSKYTLKIEGTITKEKVLKLLDIYELMNLKREKEEKVYEIKNNTLYDKIQDIIYSKLSFRPFSSKELQSIYEDVYNEPIKLSIISTYLRRMVYSGKLVREKKGREWIYSLKTTSELIGIGKVKRSPQSI